MTFIEAYALYGRDSAAIAEACGIDECDAYNLMAARADRDLGIMPKSSAEIRKELKAEAKSAQNKKLRSRLAEIRREARI